MEGSNVQQQLVALATALKDADIPFALIGGLALAPRGFPRATRDVDFLIHEASIEHVRALMHARHAELIVEDAEFSSYVDGRIRADFQHARRAISREMLERAEPIKYANIEIPVLQAEDLIGLKIQALHNNPKRLQDSVDIQQLMRANWSKLDLERVRQYFLLFDRENDYDHAVRSASANAK